MPSAWQRVWLSPSARLAVEAARLSSDTMPYRLRVVDAAIPPGA